MNHRKNSIRLMVVLRMMMICIVIISSSNMHRPLAHQTTRLTVTVFQSHVFPSNPPLDGRPDQIESKDAPTPPAQSYPDTPAGIRWFSTGYAEAINKFRYIEILIVSIRTMITAAVSSMSRVSGVTRTHAPSARTNPMAAQRLVAMDMKSAMGGMKVVSSSSSQRKVALSTGRELSQKVFAVRNGTPLDRPLRVAVIGGGPSGACAAETLAKGGVETYLIERKMDNCKVGRKWNGRVW